MERAWIFPGTGKGGLGGTGFLGWGRGPGGVGQDLRLGGSFPGRCGPIPSEGLWVVAEGHALGLQVWVIGRQEQGEVFAWSLECREGDTDSLRRSRLAQGFSDRGARCSWAEGEGSVDKTP